MTRPDYNEYMESEAWQRRRLNILVARQWRCEKCRLDCSIPQRRGYINVHHLTYERLGAEWAEDLMALCRECHRQAHGSSYARDD
jgi:5-methylcytosine-specific restriction endonuclease McrA